jgi:hypothetical protein
MFIPKALKVDCFYRFTEVLILKDLIAPICTKIVQGGQVLLTKGLGRLADPNKQKRQARCRRFWEKSTRLPIQYYTLGTTFCQVESRR